MESLYRHRVWRCTRKPAGWMVSQLGPVDDARASFPDSFLEAYDAEFEWDLRSRSEASWRADQRQTAVRTEACGFFQDAATPSADRHVANDTKAAPPLPGRAAVARIPVGEKA